MRNRCPECGYLLSYNNGNNGHSPEFCAEMAMFPLMSNMTQESRYALASIKTQIEQQNARNAAIMRTVARAPKRVGIPVDTLNPIRPNNVSRYVHK